MYIERDEYLQKLIDRKWNGLIKVITGIRRCGKSFLLFTLFRNHLLKSGVKEENIISVALDDPEFIKCTDSFVLYEYIKTRVQDSRQEYYVLIDEVQYAISGKELKDKDNPPRLYSVLNSLLRMPNVDVYVTGSNSKMLSKDVMTEFRGRGDEVKVYPLSFSEYLPASGKDREAAFNDYMLWGGLPLVLQKRSDADKSAYLEGLFSEIYIKDITERYKIQRPDVLSELIDVLSSVSGSITNITNLTNAINSMKKAKKVTDNTVRTYIGYLKDSFLFSSAQRYDIRGKAYFDSQCKYYPADTGLRNARLGFRQIEQTHLMECVIYNYLRQKGFNVDVGVVEKYAAGTDGKRRKQQHEIDFVVNKGMYQYYIQSAFSIEDKEKERKELYPFSIVGNSFSKLMITRSELLPHYDENGIFRVGIIDFLTGNYTSDIFASRNT